MHSIVTVAPSRLLDNWPSADSYPIKVLFTALLPRRFRVSQSLQTQIILVSPNFDSPGLTGRSGAGSDLSPVFSGCQRITENSDLQSSMVKRDSLSESSLSDWMKSDFGDVDYRKIPSYSVTARQIFWWKFHHPSYFKISSGNTSDRRQQKVTDWLDSFK